MKTRQPYPELYARHADHMRAIHVRAISLYIASNYGFSCVNCDFSRIPVEGEGKRALGYGYWEGTEGREEGSREGSEKEGERRGREEGEILAS